MEENWSKRKRSLTITPLLVLIAWTGRMARQYVCTISTVVWRRRLQRAAKASSAGTNGMFSQPSCAQRRGMLDSPPDMAYDRHPSNGSQAQPRGDAGRRGILF